MHNGELRWEETLPYLCSLHNSRHSIHAATTVLNEMQHVEEVALNLGTCYYCTIVMNEWFVCSHYVVWCC